jgi:hypothetical protein
MVRVAREVLFGVWRGVEVPCVYVGGSGSAEVDEERMEKTVGLPLRTEHGWAEFRKRRQIEQILLPNRRNSASKIG